MAYLPDPETAPQLFEGVLPRRAFAFVIDLFILGFLVTAVSLVGIVAGLFTFGLTWLALVFVIPGVIVLYYAATLGSPSRATLGMQAMDIVLTPTRGAPLDGGMAFLHALIFWLTTWISWPVSLAFVLFTPRRQMIHDLVTRTLMLRRSPMVQHWSQTHDAARNQA